MTDHLQTLPTDSPPYLTPAGAASAYNTVKNAQVTQDLANGTPDPSLLQIWHSFLTGPMATSVKNQADVTSNEFGNLAGARAPPSHTAANETPLTRKHEHIETKEVVTDGLQTTTRSSTRFSAGRILVLPASPSPVLSHSSLPVDISPSFATCSNSAG